MFRSLAGSLLLILLSGSNLALATDAEYYACKQTAYDKLMDQYGSMPDQASTMSERQGDKVQSEAGEYERDYDKAQANCANRHPERDYAKYNACVQKRNQGQIENPNLSCEQSYPERDIAAYNKCLDGAVNAGVTRFNKFFVRDANLATTAEAQALITQYQTEYTRAITECANLRDNSPVNSMISSCEGNSSSASSTCSSSAGSDVGSAGGNSIGSTCSDVKAKTDAAVRTLSSIQSSCSSAVSACQSSCSQGDSQVASLPAGQRSSFQSRLSMAKAKCENAQTQLAGINAAAGRAQNAQSNAGSCVSESTVPSQVADTGNQSANIGTQLPDLSSAPGGTPGTAIDNIASTPTGSTDSADFGGSFGSGGSGSGSGGSFGGISAAASAIADPLANALGSLTGAGSAPRGSGEGGGSGSQSANKPGAPRVPGRAVSAIDPNVLGGAKAGAGGVFRGDPGLYRNNGSWIPPKVGAKAKENPLDNLNLDRFRPDMKGYRKPASDDPRSQLLAADQDIWKQINIQYSVQGRTLSP